jgi:protein-disulfide isomerase
MRMQILQLLNLQIIDVSFCHKFHEETYDKVVTNFINTGKAKYLFKDFVVNDRGYYKGSMQDAVASHCSAEQGKYWEYLKEVFKNFKPKPQHWINLDSLVKFANNVCTNYIYRKIEELCRI